MFYIFHGEEEFGRSETLVHLRGELAAGDPAMAELNTNTFDGSKVTMSELRHACDTIPFMADRRLVIVNGLLSRLRSGDREQASARSEDPEWKRVYLKDLAAYLPTLPPSTRLIFVEEKTLPASHPILKVAHQETKSGLGHVKHFQPLKERDLPAWIRRHVRAKKGDIDSEAIDLLAALVGSDLRLLDQELEKLLLYVDGRRIGVEDVRALVSRAREVSIFDLVDCVGRRQTDLALKLLHQMLNDQAHPLYLLTMLARQIRILIQIGELDAEGLTENEIASRLKLHPYVVKKGLGQARNFSMAQLEAAHRCLVDKDWQIKTGKITEEVALDTLIVELTQI